MSKTLLPNVHNEKSYPESVPVFRSSPNPQDILEMQKI